MQSFDGVSEPSMIRSINMKPTFDSMKTKIDMQMMIGARRRRTVDANVNILHAWSVHKKTDRLCVVSRIKRQKECDSHGIR